MGYGEPATTGTVLERQDVWDLTRENEWHELIEWYARGVAALQAITDLSDPRSWVNLANIHGTFMPRRQWPAGIGDLDWNACQHRSWFFLPWHRMYLHHFEKIVREAVVGEGGPADWALPFWNYDPADPQTLVLPPAFRATTMPSGDPNPLFVSRRAGAINGGSPLPAGDVSTEEWPDVFTADSIATPTFGGPKTGWTHNGPAFGALELEPHGLVHVDVGGNDGNPNTGGYMSFFELAGRDPIFWLHHANIDRLWEVWRNQGHENPPDEEWLDQSYTFGSGAVQTTLAVSGVLDTTAAPLLYRYQDVPVPPAMEATRRLEATVASGRPPELVGASDVPVPLSGTATTIKVAAGDERGRSVMKESLESTGERRVYLTLENVTATDLGAGSYAVYVNAPETESTPPEENQAGKISTFGLMEASRTDDVHSGSGATYSFEITELVRSLEASGHWDPDDLRVTIVATNPEAAGSGSGIRVGRVGIYYA